MCVVSSPSGANLVEVVASEMEVRALVVNLVHKCTTLKEESSEASRAIELEKEITLLKDDLVEEYHLKDGASRRINMSLQNLPNYPLG